VNVCMCGKLAVFGVMCVHLQLLACLKLWDNVPTTCNKPKATTARTSHQKLLV
jgi:hypothetical protein